MEPLTGIAVAVRIGKKVLDVVREAREARELLRGGSLSPGEVREFGERFLGAAEGLADAHQRLADAVTRIADSTDRASQLFAIAAAWLRQGASTLHICLDLAAQQGIEVEELRKLLPPRPTE